MDLVATLGVIALFIIFGVKLLMPVDRNSTGYKLGRGVGTKIRKAGKWISDENTPKK